MPRPFDPEDHSNYLREARLDRDLEKEPRVLPRRPSIADRAESLRLNYESAFVRRDGAE